MTTQLRSPGHLTLVYDPLCGWCYGAVPSIRRLAQDHAIELVPSGLFAAGGARPMDARFAEHAWSNDQRIALLTGQPFSQGYREQVLANRSARLDSGPAVVALTAVNQVAPDRELQALEAIQNARYVQGRDTTSYDVLVRVLRDLDIAAAADRVEARSSELASAAAARMSEGRALLQEVGVTGVPTLVAHERSGLRPIPNELLYGRVDALLRHVGPATT